MDSSMLQEFRKLIKKYISGTASPGDLEQLDNYYYSFDDPGKLTEVLSEKELFEMEGRIKSNIDARISRPGKTVPIYRMAWFRAAVAVLFVSGIGAIILLRNPTHSSNVAAVRLINTPGVAVNRFIKLTDGSTVILRTGSTLKIDPNFNQKDRVVTLVGEGYFDVKHMSSKKFVVRAAGVTTTVLGTAFNIKAYPGQRNITVTVTRGLVSVAKNGHQIGLLKPQMQLTATSKSPEKVQFLPDQNNVIQWVSDDMKFDNMSFDKLAKRLSKRYNVTVIFKNPMLAGCPITGRFKGTESLTDVLDVLSITRNATYTVQDNQVIIDGPGCK